MAQSDTEIIEQALAALQASMIKRLPPLLVAKDVIDVIGITTMHPELRQYCVSKDQFDRSRMAKNWQGSILFLNGVNNEQDNNETQNTGSGPDGNPLRKNRPGERRVPAQPSESAGRADSSTANQTHSSSVQEEQRVPKTGKR